MIMDWKLLLTGTIVLLVFVPMSTGHSSLRPQSPTTSTPQVSTSVVPGQSQPVRNLPTVVPGQPSDPIREINPIQRGTPAANPTNTRTPVQATNQSCE